MSTKHSLFIRSQQKISFISSKLFRLPLQCGGREICTKENKCESMVTCETDEECSAKTKFPVRYYLDPPIHRYSSDRVNDSAAIIKQCVNNFSS